MISKFKSHNFIELKPIDSTGRNIGYSIANGMFVGRNLYYPNVLISTLENIISPYDEKIMSLNKDSFYDNDKYVVESEPSIQRKEYCPVFFFVYNFDNYYHFLYDTISYLFTYLELKTKIPELKLLINYPNPSKDDLYIFNKDILSKYVDVNDLLRINSNTYYDKIYIGTSLTHGGVSNNKPRREIFNLYKNLPTTSTKKFTKYAYISRRTWTLSDTSNIGTNYTTRRKMINEDLLVEELNKIGVEEIFTETLSIDEKIDLFSSAKLIIGSIGGGMSNLLFSTENTSSIVIVTPDFLNINNRFRYSMEHTQIQYFNDVITYKEHQDMVPLYTRIKTIENGKIGEIIGYEKSNNVYRVNMSNNDVAGFNNDGVFQTVTLNRHEFLLLDNGLNSPYIVDIEKLIKLVKNTIENLHHQ